MFNIRATLQGEELRKAEYQRTRRNGFCSYLVRKHLCLNGTPKLAGTDAQQLHMLAPGSTASAHFWHHLWFQLTLGKEQGWVCSHIPQRRVLGLLFSTVPTRTVGLPAQLLASLSQKDNTASLWEEKGLFHIKQDSPRNMSFLFVPNWLCPEKPDEDR